MQFESVQLSNHAETPSAKKGGTTQNITKVVTLLLKEDKRKLLETIKKLNTRQQYASMAQVLLKEILPRFSAEELVEQFRENGGLKEMIEATEMYSSKHYTRTDKNLKSVYYVNYVLSQMTLQEDVKKLEIQV